MNFSKNSNESSYEIIHYVSACLKIYSFSRIIIIENGLKSKIKVKMPLTIFDILSFNLRILRRFFRTDKCNVFIISQSPLKLVIIRSGVVYAFENGKLKETLRLLNCRNILHVDLCRTPSGKLLFGEYGANIKRKLVPIYSSTNEGKSWDIIYKFSPGTIKHIHCVKYDPYSNKIWTFTGDKNGECKILISDENFQSIKILGDGTQLWRACNAFFLKEKVVWMMDSPNDISYVVHFNRYTEEVKQVYRLNGPLWYSSELANGYFIAATSVEPGYSIRNPYATILISKNLTDWTEVKKFKKDKWPIEIFKNGVIAFPIGIQNLNEVYAFGEALENFDGKVIKFNFSNEI